MPAILFDIDGTLLDSVDLHARAWREAFQAFGKDVPFELIRSQIGKGGDQLLPVFLSPAELAARGKEIERVRSEIWKSRYMRHVRPFPGVRPLFIALRGRGWTPVLASSSKEDELQFYVELLEIGDLIEGSTSKDDVTRSKPHPDIFAEALDRVPAKERPGSWVVGDSPWDALAATKLDLPVLGFRSGGFPETELRSAGAREMFDGPADLLAHLDQSPFEMRR